MNEAVSLINQLKANTLKISPNQWALAIDIDPEKIKDYTKAIDEATNRQKNFRDENENLKLALEGIAKAEEEITNAGQKTDRYATFDKLKNALENLDFDKLDQILAGFKRIGLISDETKEKILTNAKGARDSYKQNEEAINSNIQKINEAKLAQTDFASTIQGDVVNAEREAADNALKYRDDLVETARASIDASKGIEQLVNSLTSFLSIGNAIHLLTRTIRSAFNTIKELDAAMTETATVTEYSVSEMWDKLDEYTEIANKLGATTLGTYKTITLFFQQGLDEQQSLALATETMKMARVAGIDYAEATQYMTSALRGFNMELNETSATRVNDVYSELAKITAADTNQIAIAMSKVASLANSANMELETTSAFLSQIIETTQEAPETAGTALKTIIARFSEVKKLFKEGELIGADSEGEAIDVNKISVALRTAGIDLNKFILGNVGLDEIFMQLAEKWDDLTLLQQRYIATQAAGSRQQSRFIAMMQDYDRTLELVNAAYNSAGSGQEQFDKTLESIEAKLNKLKNSWESFTMSISNSEAVKVGVDALNTLLTIINKITDAFGSASGAMKLFLASGLGTAAGQLFTPALKAMSQNFSSGGNLTTALGAAGGTFQTSFQNVGASLRSMIDPAFAQQNYLNNLNDQLKNLDKSADNYAQTEARLQKQIADANDSMTTQIITGKNVGRTLQLIGLGASAASQALKKYADRLDDGPNKQFALSLSQVASVLGTVSLAAGTLTRTLPGLADTVGKILGSLSGTEIGLIVAGVAAVATVVATVTATIQNQKQALADWDNQAQKIQDDIIGMNDGINNFTEAADGLANLKKGTLEWAVQLERAKKIYEDLIKLYPALEPFLQFDVETGLYTFDKDAYTKDTTRRQELIDKNKRYEAIEPFDIYDSIRRSEFYYQNSTQELNKNFTKESLLQLYPWIGGIEDTEFESLIKELVAESDKGYSREELTAKMAKIYGEESEAWNSMNFYDLYGEYIDMFLDAWAQKFYDDLVNSGAIKERLTDLKGQNIYATYGADQSEEGKQKLTQQLDLGIESDTSAAALYGYWSTLEELPDTLRADEDAMKGLALETASALKHFDDLNKILKQNKDVLASGEKSAEAYGVAIGEIWATLKSALGDSISYEFIRDNIDDVLAAFRDGSEDALFRLQDKLIDTFDIASFLEDQQQNLELPITLDEAQIQTIRDTLAELTQDQEFRLTGVGDFTALWDLLTKTYGISEDVANAMIQQFMLQGILIDDGKGNWHYQVSNVGSQGVRNAKANAGGGKKSSGGGGSSKKEKPWENPYDQLYNLTERNEEAIRRRNILEKQYNAILRDREGTSTQLLRNSLQELANLQEQLSYQRQLQRGRQAQLDAVNSEMYMDSEGTRKSYSAWGVTKYAKYNQETNAIEIDWDAIDKVTDQTTGKAIEDYIKRLEELQKQFEKVDSDILDIEEEIDEINQRGKGEYLDFEQRVYDAIVQTYQDVIDSFSSLNDTINDSNEKILDDLQEQIDLERQIRDNTKEEEEIGSKEARLAYLQRDTSGANATEILRLQEEIADARQNYTDKLIDQKLTQLSKDNDDAAEQRQMQITLMQEQLDYWTKIGAFWTQVNELLFEALDKDGRLKNNTQLVELLKETEGFIGMSTFSKENWEDDLAKNFIEAMQGYGSWMMEQAEKKGSITQDGNTYKYDKDKKVWMMGNEAYSAVYNTAAGRYEFTRVRDKDVQVGTIGNDNSTSGSSNGSGNTGDNYTNNYTEPYDTYSNWSVVDYMRKNGEQHYVRKKRTVTHHPSGTTKVEYKYFDENHSFSGDTCTKCGYTRPRSNNATTITTTLSRTKPMLRNAGGGRVYETGPTWLDGTKANPEAVLSAKQTEMFISLRDLLEHITQSGGLTSNSFGNTYVDLDVNADIGSDYDVDSLVNRLKRDILESSNYRNVNALTRGH